MPNPQTVLNSQTHPIQPSSPQPSTPSQIVRHSLPTLQHISCLSFASRKQIYKLISNQVQTWKDRPLSQLAQLSVINNDGDSEEIMGTLCGWMGEMLQILLSSQIKNIGNWRQNITTLLSESAVKVQAIIGVLQRREQQINANLTNKQKLASLAQQFSKLLNFLYSEQPQNGNISTLDQIVEAQASSLDRLIVSKLAFLEFDPYFATFSPINQNRTTSKIKNNRKCKQNVVQQTMQMEMYSDESFNPEPRTHHSLKHNPKHNRKNNSKHSLNYLLCDELILQMRGRFDSVYDCNIRHGLSCNINEVFGLSAGHKDDNRQDRKEEQIKICDSKPLRYCEMETGNTIQVLNEQQQNTTFNMDNSSIHRQSNKIADDNDNDYVNNNGKQQQQKQDHRQNTSEQQHQHQHLLQHYQQQLDTPKPTQLNSQPSGSMGTSRNYNGCHIAKYYVSGNHVQDLEDNGYHNNSNNVSEGMTVTMTKRRNTFEVYYIDD